MLRRPKILLTRGVASICVTSSLLKGTTHTDRAVSVMTGGTSHSPTPQICFGHLLSSSEILLLPNTSKLNSNTDISFLLISTSIHCANNDCTRRICFFKT